MKKLIETLARLGAAELSDLLGGHTVSLLELLGLKHLQPHRLAELALAQIGFESLLLDRRRRNDLTDALSKDDVTRLDRLLGLSESDDPWAAVRAVPASRGSAACQVILAFFGCSLEDEEATCLEAVESTTVQPEYPLFPHQIRACREIMGYLRQESRPRVLLHMPTGAGKTRTAMNAIAAFFRDRFAAGTVVVWLAHTEELCEQAAMEFEKAWAFLGNRELPVHRAFGPYRVQLDRVVDGVLFGGLQLLYSRSLSEQSIFLELARRVSLVVMDEAHQAVAPTYAHVLNILTAHPRTAILGLSATPGRSLLDAHQDMELALFFDRNKVTLQVEGYENPIAYLQAEGYLAEVSYEYIRYAPGEELTLTEDEIDRLRTELELPDSIIKRLGQDHKRNLLIITRLIEEARNGGKIIVFACSVEHAHLIADILSAKGLSAVAVTTRTSPSRRRQAIASFRTPLGLQILCNYGVLTMGFDAPKTNCAVITRPTKSVVLYSQMVGRAARGPKAGGNSNCKIITVVDQLPGFRSIAEAFNYFEEIWE